MGEIINFPGCEQCGCEPVEYMNLLEMRKCIDVLIEANEEIVGAYERQHEKMMKLSQLTLFERVFKWPYRRKDE